MVGHKVIWVRGLTRQELSPLPTVGDFRADAATRDLAPMHSSFNEIASLLGSVEGDACARSQAASQHVPRPFRLALQSKRRAITDLPPLPAKKLERPRPGPAIRRGRDPLALLDSRPSAGSGQAFHGDLSRYSEVVQESAENVREEVDQFEQALRDQAADEPHENRESGGLEDIGIESLPVLPKPAGKMR
jgi:hypothetical protein